MRVNFEDAASFAFEENIYFSLKDDGDSAEVRFMFDGMDSLYAYVCHRVTGDEVNFKDRKVVSCIAEDFSGKGCPLCASDTPKVVRYLIPLRLEETGEYRLWERGRSFMKVIVSRIKRTPDLYRNVFEVFRNGKKGDTRTTYDLERISSDDSEWEDYEMPKYIEFPEFTIPYWTDRDMKKWLKNGEFPIDERRPEAREEDSNGDTVADIASKTKAKAKASGKGRKKKSSDDDGVDKIKTRRKAKPVVEEEEDIDEDYEDAEDFEDEEEEEEERKTKRKAKPAKSDRRSRAPKRRSSRDEEDDDEEDEVVDF